MSFLFVHLSLNVFFCQKYLSNKTKQCILIFFKLYSLFYLQSYDPVSFLSFSSFSSLFFFFFLFFSFFLGTTFNYALSVLKTDPTNISRMLPALIMLSASALNPEVAQHMLDNGAVGALLNAIRMNPNNPKVQCSSVNVLLALGKSIGATLFISNGTFH